jgi:hypothetical protein
MMAARIVPLLVLVTIPISAHHRLAGGNMANASLLAILVAAASGFLVGGLWYGPLFGKAWQRAIGLSDEEIASGNMLKIFGTTFLLSIVSALFLGHLLAHFDSDFTRTMMISVGVALGFVVPAIGTNYLFGRKSGPLFLIDAGYWIAFYAAMGLVFGLLGA